jgi:hypothetical protein
MQGLSFIRSLQQLQNEGKPVNTPVITADVPSIHVGLNESGRQNPSTEANLFSGRYRRFWGDL